MARRSEVDGAEDKAEQAEIVPGRYPAHEDVLRLDRQEFAGGAKRGEDVLVGDHGGPWFAGRPGRQLEESDVISTSPLLRERRGSRHRGEINHGQPGGTTSRGDPFRSGSCGQHQPWPHPSGSGGGRPRRDLRIESTGSRRQSLQGEESADEGQTRGQHEDDPVSTSDAKASEATGESLGLGPQLRVRDGFRSGGKSQSGGSFSGAAGQHRIKRLNVGPHGRDGVHDLTVPERAG